MLPAAVISASHNPFVDNGIKLLAAGGRKLSDAEEATVESELESCVLKSGAAPDRGRPVRRLEAVTVWAASPRLPRSGPGTAGRWWRAWRGGRLDGVKVVIDCANGAATDDGCRPSSKAPAPSWSTSWPRRRTGVNINDGCGSTDPSGAGPVGGGPPGADVGLAFDGDADRVIAVDDEGHVVDGDRLLALFATDLHRPRACWPATPSWSRS